MKFAIKYLFIKGLLKGKKYSFYRRMGGVESIILSNNNNISLHLIEKIKIKYFGTLKKDTTN